MNDKIPEGATHKNTGFSHVKWIRVTPHIHDWWSNHENRWITFEGGHNPIRDNWESISNIEDKQQ